MNNQGNNNNDNIDDILGILQQKKEKDIQGGKISSDEQTKIHSAPVIKPQNAVTGASSAPKQPTSAPKAKGQSTPQKRTSSKGNSSLGSSVSLSDFDKAYKSQPTRQVRKTKQKTGVPRYIKVIIYLFFVIAASILISIFVIRVANDVFAFVKSDEEISITINEGDELSDIAHELYEKGIIEYPTIYKIFASFKMKKSPGYFTGDFVSGQHVLSPNFNYDKLLYSLAESKYSSEIVRVTIPEGYTAREIVEMFVEKRIVSQKNKQKFIDMINSVAFEYDFMPQIAAGEDTDKIYMLEGYLFPDTYDFYINENLDSIVNKFLTNFNKKFEEAYYTRAADLGFTVDEIITIASMIEAEGNNDEDFYKISSVFHNRLKSASFPYLNSDATTLYSFQGEKKQLDAGDNKTRVHPYNTYLNRGLPPGAICNPGSEAIHAALYPDSTNYYYFYTASTNGITYFSSSEAQHNRYIQADRNGTIGN